MGPVTPFLPVVPEEVHIQGTRSLLIEYTPQTGGVHVLTAKTRLVVPVHHPVTRYYTLTYVCD